MENYDEGQNIVQEAPSPIKQSPRKEPQQPNQLLAQILKDEDIDFSPNQLHG